MDKETSRIEHLKVIQAVTERMGRNSFTIKAGTITTFAAIMAVTLGINNWIVSAIGILPVLLLWGLDAFYIRHERLYRILYDEVRTGEAADIGSSQYFTMNTGHLSAQVNNILKTMVTRTLPFFYIPLVLVLVILTFTS